MRELSLFSGAGGGLLATKHLLNWETVGYVEFDEYCQAVLAQRIEDGYLDSAPIFGDIRKFISEGYAETYKKMVDVITAGFPCQPFSQAGKQKGEKDERNLWPETIECIRQIQPRFALLENVPSLLGFSYIRRIYGDLAEMGYNARWMVLAAKDVGAPHERKRLWILAYTDLSRNRFNRFKNINWDFRNRSKGTKMGSVFDDCCKIKDDFQKWEIESGISGIVDGLGFNMDRLKAIGNGQVPQVVELAWKILSDGLVE